MTDIDDLQQRIGVLLREHEHIIVSDDRLADLAGRIAGAVTANPARFWPATRSGARRRLDRAADAMEKAASALAELHDPEIDVIADTGARVTIGGGSMDLARAIVRGDFQRMLSELATAIVAADVSDIPEAVEGRPVKLRERLVARRVIEAFEALTGQNTKKSGQSAGLLKLVSDVFKLRGLDPSTAKNALDGAQAHRK
jgi:hypothetical protein